MKQLLAIVFLIPLSLSAEVSKLEYHGFTLWFDCKTRTAIKFQYELDRDVGAIRHIHQYYHDPMLAPYCQQLGRQRELERQCQRRPHSSLDGALPDTFYYQQVAQPDGRLTIMRDSTYTSGSAVQTDGTTSAPIIRSTKPEIGLRSAT